MLFAELEAKLREVAPEGIDMYFDNVGGIHFEAAMACLRPQGRVAICGTISSYNEAGCLSLFFFFPLFLLVWSWGFFFFPFVGGL